MPRRIRLTFDEGQGQRCSLTGADDPIIVKTYRTRNYGIDYREGFLHPLTPYYAPKVGAAKLPVHLQPGGISYRHWPGVVVESEDRLRQPAQAVCHGLAERRAVGHGLRFAAFGYDMDNMKARAWIDSEMPILSFADDELRDRIDQFIRQATAGASTVARRLVGAVKTARYDRPADAIGDYGFVAERFFRETEPDFYDALRRARRLIEEDAPDPDDATYQARQGWAPRLARAALRLFDEYVPADGLEDRDMHRYVKARFFLALAPLQRIARLAELRVAFIKIEKSKLPLHSTLPGPIPSVNSETGDKGEVFRAGLI